jgi:hypothetical protein
VKKLTLFLIPLLLISILGAADFDLSGEFRTRAAMYNDTAEDAGGHIDSRFRLGLDSTIIDGLKIHAMFEVGNILWGDSASGGGLDTGGINVKTDELYIDYLIKALDANVRVGQQYWGDHRGLVLDDFFSGVVLSKETSAGMKAELGLLKVMDTKMNKDGFYDVLMANLEGKLFVPFGLAVMYGNQVDTTDVSTGNISILPYITLSAGPATLDIAPFFDYQILSEVDDEMGFGVSAKADVDLGIFAVGGDVLYAGENGITTLSPWYQNGLYLYGIGAHHDGLNLYWDTPYSFNSDNFISAVANIGVPISNKAKVFAAAGSVSELGTEINGGIEFQVIPDTMSLTGYGAYGMHDETDVNNYAFGTTLQINF